MTGPEVHFRVADDAEASRIAALLEALGYAPIREVDNPEARARWIVETFSRRYRLTSRERDLLECMLAGQSAAETAATLKVSRATVKWHTHNMLGKVGVHTREALLHLALRTSADTCPLDAPALAEVEPPSETAPEAKAWF